MSVMLRGTAPQHPPLVITLPGRDVRSLESHDARHDSLRGFSRSRFFEWSSPHPRSWRDSSLCRRVREDRRWPEPDQTSRESDAANQRMMLL